MSGNLVTTEKMITKSLLNPFTTYLKLARADKDHVIDFEELELGTHFRLLLMLQGQ